MNAKRQHQIKQVWFNDEDEINFQAVAADMKRRGIDVEPDSRRAKADYSHTKVMRHLLSEAAGRLGPEYKPGVPSTEETGA